MTDPELQGIAAQAFNMARTQIEFKGDFNFLLASYYAGEGLRRMTKIEKFIPQTLGEDWLNNGRKKDAAFDILRLALRLHPSDAIVFATGANIFTTTAKFDTLPKEEQEKLLKAGHDKHHAAVKSGYLKLDDALACVAQTPERVCSYTRILGDPDEKARALIFNQSEFDGRLKLYGEPT